MPNYFDDGEELILDGSERESIWDNELYMFHVTDEQTDGQTFDEEEITQASIEREALRLAELEWEASDQPERWSKWDNDKVDIFELEDE